MKCFESHRASHHPSLLKNLRELAATAKILYQQGGVRGLALLPFCHVGYVTEDNAQFVHQPQFEKVKKMNPIYPQWQLKLKYSEMGNI